MNRRSFLFCMSAGATALSGIVFSPCGSVAAMFNSPVTTNCLRPPGAVSEELFPSRCIRCGRCVEVCPYRSIVLLDIRAGVYAGTPVVEVDKIPCYLCMKCVDVCPTGSLKRIEQHQTRMGLAVVNKFDCSAWAGTILCRTCYDKCPYPEKAIRLDQLRPVVDEKWCTGCGLCTHACPVTVKKRGKAINIVPLYAEKKVGR